MPRPMETQTGAAGPHERGLSEARRVIDVDRTRRARSRTPAAHIVQNRRALSYCTHTHSMTHSKFVLVLCALMALHGTPPATVRDMLIDIW